MIPTLIQFGPRGLMMFPLSHQMFPLRHQMFPRKVGMPRGLLWEDCVSNYILNQRYSKLRTLGNSTVPAGRLAGYSVHHSTYLEWR